MYIHLDVYIGLYVYSGFAVRTKKENNKQYVQKLYITLTYALAFQTKYVCSKYNGEYTWFSVSKPVSVI